MITSAPIGIFDSGYGGLTVLKEIKKQLPGYDYLYLGDNARSPYGPRSFETVYDYTLQCVQWLFAQGCPLIIVACNTASAKALRSIQQKYLPLHEPDKRVLGVIRPTAEIIGNYSSTKEIGILGTKGTVQSDSYLIEVAHFFPDVKVYQHACPMWVPLVENNEYADAGADYFIKKDINILLNKSPEIDTILLACTHYPLLLEKINHFLPENIKVVSQGPIVAESLADYLVRHPDLESLCSKPTLTTVQAGYRTGRQNNSQFFTTDSPVDFDKHSEIFFGEKVASIHVDL